MKSSTEAAYSTVASPSSSRPPPTSTGHRPGTPHEHTPWFSSDTTSTGPGQPGNLRPRPGRTEPGLSTTTWSGKTGLSVKTAAISTATSAVSKRSTTSGTATITPSRLRTGPRPNNQIRAAVNTLRAKGNRTQNGGSRSLLAATPDGRGQAGRC